MKDTTISVTQAARNFADCVNRVHYQQVTYVLLKNGLPYARLSPENAKLCSATHLAEILSGELLSTTEAKRWHRDRQAAHKALRSQADKWR
ncbi:MAG: hypothetical protein ACP5I8_10255 [Phycisphaerae bacterium]